MARVSVIVPTYNRVGYLEEAIASILSQDYHDFELVVADNASTDGTAALLAGVTHPRLRHVRRAHNLGWRANFNQALRGADSEFVALVSDDDRLVPGALTRAVSVMVETPNVGFVHTTVDVIDDRGGVVSTENWTAGPIEDRVERGSDFIVGSMRKVSQVCLSSALIRMAALPEVCFQAADEECGDVVLFLRVALDWDVGFLATPGVELRVHAGQLSNARDTSETAVAVCDAKLRFLSAHAARVEHVGELERALRRFTAAEMSLPVSMAARESRTAGFSAFRRALRMRPQLVLAPRTWRTGVKIAVGPRVLGRVRAMRPSREVHGG
jgi:hypothetical protein